MKEIRIPLKPYQSQSELERQIKDLSDSYIEILNKSTPANLMAEYLAEHTEVVSVEAKAPEVKIKYEVTFSAPDSNTDIYPLETLQREATGFVEKLTLVFKSGQ